MPATDGSLIFNTKIDTSGVGKGAKELDKEVSESANKIKTILSDTEKSAKSKAAAIAAEYRKMGKSQSDAFKEAWKTIRQDGEATKKTSTEVFKETSDAITETAEDTAHTAAKMKDDVSDSFSGISKSSEETGEKTKTTFEGLGKNIMESRDWITMAAKAIIGALKMTADAADSIFTRVAGATANSVKLIANGIGQITAQTGKFTLKQFIGDWDSSNSGMKRMLMMAASAFSAYKLYNFGKEGIELGSDLSEVQNVVDVTFSHMTDKVDEWAKSAQKAYGLSETMAKKFVGLYGSMSKAFGFSEQEAFEMSSTLAGLAGDVASFYNLDQDLAYTKLKSVFSGETETLKDLGIVMTENALNDYAMRKGIGKTVSKMSEAEKVTLRYDFVLEQLNSAAGDFTRTQSSWANQTRLLSLRWDTLKATMGRGFINALTPALRFTNLLLEKIQKIADWFENFSTAIFGNSAAASGAVTEGLETAADTADDLADSIENVSKKSDDLRYGLAGFDELNLLTDNGDSESADEIVDDLAKASGVIDSLAEDTKENAEKTLSNIGFSQAVKSAIEKGNWRMVGFLIAENINEAINHIPWNNIQPQAVKIARNVGEFINGAFQSPALWITIGNTIAEGLNTAIGFLLSLLQTIDFSKIGFSFAEMLNEFLNTFDADKFGKLVAERINAVFDFIGGFAFRFNWNRLGDKIGETLASYFQNLNLTEAGKSGKTIPETIAGMINGLIQAGISLLTYEFTDENGELHNLWEYIGTVLGEGLNSFLENFSISDAVTLVKSGVKSFIGMISKAFQAIAGEDGDGFKRLGAELAVEANKWLSDDSWWTDIGESLGEIFNDILDFAIVFIGGLDMNKVIEAVEKLLEAMDIEKIVSKLFFLFSLAFLKLRQKIPGLIAEVMSWIGDYIANHFDFSLPGMFKTWFSEVVDEARMAWDGIKKVFEPVADWFQNVFSNAWQKVKDVFSAGGNVFNGIKEGIYSVFSGVVNHLIDGINSIIGNAFNGLNTAIFTVRDFEFLGNKPFGFIQTIDVPQIPRLATGTVVPANYGEFLAVLGDNRREPEVVCPVSSIKQAVREVLAENGYGGDSDRPINVTVVLQDGSVLFRAMGEEDDKFYRSHGFSRFDRRKTT